MSLWSAFLTVFSSILIQVFRVPPWTLSVFREWRESHKTLSDWVEKNPDKFIGDVPYAQDLVLRCILSHRQMILLFPKLGEHRWIAYLLSLLNERGPDPPFKSFPVLEQPRHEGGVVLILYWHNRSKFRMAR